MGRQPKFSTPTEELVARGRLPLVAQQLIVESRNPKLIDAFCRSAHIDSSVFPALWSVASAAGALQALNSTRTESDIDAVIASGETRARVWDSITAQFALTGRQERASVALVPDTALKGRYKSVRELAFHRFDDPWAKVLLGGCSNADEMLFPACQLAAQPDVEVDDLRQLVNEVAAAFPVPGCRLGHAPALCFARPELLDTFVTAYRAHDSVGWLTPLVVSDIDLDLREWVIGELLGHLNGVGHTAAELLLLAVDHPSTTMAQRKWIITQLSGVNAYVTRKAVFAPDHIAARTHPGVPIREISDTETLDAILYDSSMHQVTAWFTAAMVASLACNPHLTPAQGDRCAQLLDVHHASNPALSGPVVDALRALGLGGTPNFEAFVERARRGHKDQEFTWHGKRQKVRNFANAAPWPKPARSSYQDEWFEGAVEHAATHLYESLGEDRELWEFVFASVDTWTESVNDLAAVAKAVL